MEWYQRRVPGDGREYHVNTESEVSWEDAQAWCKKRGANLAQPTDNLNTFMKEVAQRVPVKQGNVRVWLGATDLAQEGEWRWLSGRPVDHFNTPWGENNPSNSGNLEHCMEIQIETFSEVTLKINDNRCDALQHFACEL
uniref:C-type-lectin-like-9 protein n=1 Tax=Pagurus bernhardus TaxID=174397 RepID=W6MNH1_PAGBR